LHRKYSVPSSADKRVNLENGYISDVEFEAIFDQVKAKDIPDGSSLYNHTN
jgi:hypothetical protein